METFPAYFPLRGKRLVIAGDGEPAEAKARLFATSPATVVRVDGAAALDPMAYAGADLVFVASFDPVFRAAAGRAARACGAPLNVVDAPELSDFHTPAIIDRGQVVAAVGTAGASPLLASLLRSELEILVPEGAGPMAALLGTRREAVREAFPDLARRRAFLRGVLAGPAGQAAARGDASRAALLLDAAIIGGETSALGRISFIALGTSPDLISLRAVRELAVADVVLAGPPAEPLLAHHGRRDAERRRLEDGDLPSLVALAKAGRIVAVLDEPADGLIVGLRTEGVAVEWLRAAVSS